MAWLPQRSVVVPIDFSEDSKAAVEAALELVKKPEDVHVIHIMYPLDIVSPGVVWEGVDDENREKAVEKHMSTFLKENSFTSVQVATRIGDPGHEIAAYATSVSASLIVIPTHGFHGIKRVLLGSVAENVIRHADCAVLTLRRADAD